MPKPAPSWIDRLPQDRAIAEISMWSADLSRLAHDLARIAPFADILHLDVADGVFAPSFLFFPDLVAALRGLTDLPMHVHLMVDDRVLLSQIAQFTEAGADLISFHAENDALAGEALAAISEGGAEAGVVLRVETPVARAAPLVDRVRFVTLLGTAIGVKGQGLDPAATARLGAARALIAARRAPGRCVLAADGGIRETTVPDLLAAGAETVVMGSLAFGAADLPARFAWLHGLRR
jgi:ribulose-phosphate 3-epimerase